MDITIQQKLIFLSFFTRFHWQIYCRGNNFVICVWILRHPLKSRYVTISDQLWHWSRSCLENFLIFIQYLKIWNSDLTTSWKHNLNSVYNSFIWYQHFEEPSYTSVSNWRLVGPLALERQNLPILKSMFILRKIWKNFKGVHLGM